MNATNFDVASQLWFESREWQLSSLGFTQRFEILHYTSLLWQNNRNSKRFSWGVGAAGGLSFCIRKSVIHRGCCAWDCISLSRFSNFPWERHSPDSSKKKRGHAQVWSPWCKKQTTTKHTHTLKYEIFTVVRAHKLAVVNSSADDGIKQLCYPFFLRPGAQDCSSRACGNTSKFKFSAWVFIVLVGAF